MGLEQDIQQANFRNDYQRGLINIIYSYYWLTDKTKSFYKPLGITSQQYNILRILRGSHPTPLTVNNLKERMLDKMSDTSRLVDRLVKKGLVVKQKNARDKRISFIHITESGLALLKKADESVSKMDEILSNLDHHEIIQLNNLLDKLRADI